MNWNQLILNWSRKRLSNIKWIIKPYLSISSQNYPDLKLRIAWLASSIMIGKLACTFVTLCKLKIKWVWKINGNAMKNIKSTFLIMAYHNVIIFFLRLIRKTELNIFNVFRETIFVSPTNKHANGCTKKTMQKL